MAGLFLGICHNPLHRLLSLHLLNRQPYCILELARYIMETTTEDMGFPQFTNFTLPSSPKTNFDYFARGADGRITLEENKSSWKALMIVPRVLVDVSNVDTSIEFAGLTLSKLPFQCCLLKFDVVRSTCNASCATSSIARRG